ncbi:bacteriohemerythrin [Clostridium saccharoperbutylacetonicum]|jgi:hemerythrin|uniref:Hemerythrin-like metal-binding protein n=1 Tax=Clostridium saccharoperbutylacetonicum N1-4(HMT) TaxID=931276 RepID=M1MQD1_9CLOT|nr:bacteriohemerythrin [Clostridium saccharoperbutylacetonicum]AGF58393.1 hemerythrin-like metal-binding protein [Clostridium saccharoperbutylacetonicum N1-4(HMT)]AQR97086.1 bacteriohemerythrin [Clostridium saccharoperbutylacetonicum]NRT60829.1 hemerythrin [Clostridium saccharoperbutylacetonicum]NSB24143.1 hemerythrin [Clostridium saccharoperbutylacetonicum]NSB32967.1 hemerythrin [Clostridium saccharoperbutylacetonicum]
MAAFQWKDEYNLNIEEIDKQHRKLMEIGKKAYDIAVIDDGYDRYDEIMTILDELLEYTKYHFEYEENMLKQYNYEHIHNQEEEHAFYVYKIKQVASREDIDENQRKVVLEIIDFLSKWISEHIMGADKEYAVFLKKLKVA